MFKSSRRMILKLAALCLLAASAFAAQYSSASAAMTCPMICWENHYCNYVTGECECNCPEPSGFCPQSCA